MTIDGLIFTIFSLYTSLQRFDCGDIKRNTSLNHPIQPNASQKAIQTHGTARVIYTPVFTQEKSQCSRTI
jgi:hypothetical protein